MIAKLDDLIYDPEKLKMEFKWLNGENGKAKL